MEAAECLLLAIGLDTSYQKILSELNELTQE